MCALVEPLQSQPLQCTCQEFFGGGSKNEMWGGKRREIMTIHETNLNRIPTKPTKTHSTHFAKSPTKGKKNYDRFFFFFHNVVKLKQLLKDKVQ